VIIAKLIDLGSKTLPHHLLPHPSLRIQRHAASTQRSPTSFLVDHGEDHAGVRKADRSMGAPLREQLCPLSKGTALQLPNLNQA
jgi:hypothetical protein